jgi:hypothetical protein
MLKRTLVGLAFILGATTLNTSPASAFGWCGWGGGARYSPMAYSYAPRTRAYYRPARFYRPALYRRAFYRPGFRAYRGAYYRPFVRRAYYRPFVGRAYYRPGVRVYRRAQFRPAVTRSFYRPGVRATGPRTRAFYGSTARGFRPAAGGRYRGRLP